MDIDFENSLQFLFKYSNIFNFQITRILVEKQWLNIDKQWLSFLSSLKYEDLNKIPFSKDFSDISQYKSCPGDLQTLISDACQFSLSRDYRCDRTAGSDTTHRIVLTSEEIRGMNPKKRHEIECLSSIVYESCQEFRCKNVVDVGSGLGYLGQILSSRFGYRVFGLESKECNTDAANTWVKKKNVDEKILETITFQMKDEATCYQDFDKLIASIKQQQHFGHKTTDQQSDKECRSYDFSKVFKSLESNVTPEQGNPSGSLSAKPSKMEADTMNIEQNSAGSLSNNNVCMTGLHCCGDLTPTMLKFFAKCKDLTCLVCLGCCYHNMSVDDYNNYNMWPLSQAFITTKLEFSMLNKYALRLAAQETRTRWKSQSAEAHQYHMKNVAFRGLLELFCHQENIQLFKEKRKIANKKDYTDLNSYITAVVDRMKFDKPVDYIRKRMHELYREYEEGINFIEAITCLQVILQPVIESVIVMDRVLYLREHGVISKALPVFDETISPRNLAILAWKI